MRFEVEKEEDKQFPVWSDGKYVGYIIECEETVAQSSGKPMFKLNVEVLHFDKKQKIYDYATCEVGKQWKLRELSKSVGINDKYKAGNMVPSDLLGKKVVCNLITEIYDNKKRNKIKSYCPLDTQTTLPPMQTTEQFVAELDSDIPF